MRPPSPRILPAGTVRPALSRPAGFAASPAGASR